VRNLNNKSAHFHLIIQVNKALAKGPHKFFKLFDPVFKRNARFAVKKPVPELGDMDTPMPQVRVN
jgi:hypothetical protein